MERDAPLAEPEESAKRKRRFTIPWLRLVIVLAVVGLTLWYGITQVDWERVIGALRTARWGFVWLGFGSVLLVNIGKAWRWQHLFHPKEQRPPFAAAFWALMLGQVVNALSPLRVGELARVASLHDMTGSSRGQALGTLLVEKNLEMLFLGLTVVLLIPFLILPEFMTEAAAGVAVAIALAGSLYLLAFRTEWTLSLVGRLANWLPNSAERQLLRLANAGLRGLAILRDHRATLRLLLLSAVITFAMWLAPWSLFPAFGIPFGLPEAALLNAGILFGISLPSAPAKIGVFELSVFFVLNRLGLEDESLIIGYALLLHLVVLLPQIILGGWAALALRAENRRHRATTE